MKPEQDIDDVGEAIRDGRALRPASAFRIKVANESLDYRDVDVPDPIPIGRQILAAAGARPVEDHSLFALLENGDFEDLRLDEPFDLCGKGAERFVMFKTDRTFKLTIDNRQIEWGKPVISGTALRRLAAVQPGYALYLEVRGGHDREIDDKDVVDLAKTGTERFITVIKETTEGLAALPSADRAYLAEHGIDHQLFSEAGQTGVVLKDFALPPDRFDRATADVLILLPMGYPDACPDMFFTTPWLRLATGGGLPSRADVAHAFAGTSWQRWSRHSGAWRPGVDGLHTMIARARHALETAR